MVFYLTHNLDMAVIELTPAGANEVPLFVRGGGTSCSRGPSTPPGQFINKGLLITPLTETNTIHVYINRAVLY